MPHCFRLRTRFTPGSTVAQCHSFEEAFDVAMVPAGGWNRLPTANARGRRASVASVWATSWKSFANVCPQPWCAQWRTAPLRPLQKKRSRFLSLRWTAMRLFGISELKTTNPLCKYSCQASMMNVRGYVYVCSFLDASSGTACVERSDGVIQALKLSIHASLRSNPRRYSQTSLTVTQSAESPTISKNVLTSPVEPRTTPAL